VDGFGRREWRRWHRGRLWSDSGGDECFDDVGGRVAVEGRTVWGR